MGAPIPLVKVASVDVCSYHSRSSPVVEDRIGVSQLSGPGKYRNNINLASPDGPPPFRIRHRSELHIYYQNVGGINTCINDFLLACSDGCYDIIALAETWLDDRTLSSQACGSNYDVFRTDRNQLNSTKSIGGGVLIAIHRRLKAQLIEEIEWSCTEQVWVSIKLDEKMLYFCVVYIPPDRTRDVALINAHEQPYQQSLPVCNQLTK